MDTPVLEKSQNCQPLVQMVWVCMCYFKSSLNIYFTVQVEVLAVQGEEGQMSTSSTLAETTLPAMMTDQLEGKLSGA